jgi:hypothetical protein
MAGASSKGRRCFEQTGKPFQHNASPRLSRSEELVVIFDNYQPTITADLR